MSDHLLFEMDGAVAWLTLYRPESLNAMSNDMMRDLAETLDRCADDDSVRAVVLTGAGERAFCAGGDVKGMASRNTGATPERSGGAESRGPAPTLDDRINSLLQSMRA